ncbi:hypothetical protein [Bartonella tribocorum]|nr:hypothetical protein [Bartonella tribocorum]CDO49886.1 hypothetical protein BM1374166_02243 [Bartonella tribocorum]
MNCTYEKLYRCTIHKNRHEIGITALKNVFKKAHEFLKQMYLVTLCFA